MCWIAALAVTYGCGGTQSALDPAGRDALRIAELFGWMAAGSLLIWAAVVALAAWAPRRHSDPAAIERAQGRLIVGGGLLLPLAVLTPLLAFGLAAIPPTLAPGPAGGLSIDVTGQQWWWRVRYVVPGSTPIDLANEIRLPVGARTTLRLTSADVIHSFWVPSLAGKMDMIPGRRTEIALEPQRAGTFRGACAEFCGTSHARMNLVAVAMERDAFERWLAHEATPAQPPASAQAERGRAAFFTNGCNTCHTIRGTNALGVAGPDLTHVGARETIAAGTLPTAEEHLREWITRTRAIKPEARMPAFTALPDDDLSALAVYLAGLR